MTDTRETQVRPEALLGRVEIESSAFSATQAMGDIGARASRAFLHRLMRRIKLDHLTVVEGADVSLYGTEGHLSAIIHIVDPRAWKAVASEGSIGLGRGYIEGWWTTDDLTKLIQVLVRNLGELDDFRNKVSRRTNPVTDRLRRIAPSGGRDRNKEDIASHYDVGNDFFKIFLDDSMTYSSGVFESPSATLAQASQAKYDRLLNKLQIAPGHELLEIGTGWGGLAQRVLERFAAHVTTTTVSDQQLREARRRISEAGFSDRVVMLDSDWRDLKGQYDRIVSIEMIEAVEWRDYKQFFATIESCLKPDGLVGIQAICTPDQRFDRAKNTEDYIRRFVFPGGMLPSIGAISKSVSAATKLQLLDVEDFSAHYAETLRRWRVRFDERIDEVLALGLDDRFCRLWRFYLAYCEAAFLERHVTVNQIVLAGHQWRPNGLSLRPN